MVYASFYLQELKGMERGLLGIPAALKSVSQDDYLHGWFDKTVSNGTEEEMLAKEPFEPAWQDPVSEHQFMDEGTKKKVPTVHLGPVNPKWTLFMRLTLPPWWLPHKAGNKGRQ